MLVELTNEMMVVLAVLAITVGLFVTEVFRIDFTAILVMIALGTVVSDAGVGKSGRPEPAV